MTLCAGAGLLSFGSGLAATTRSCFSMREITSGASADLLMKSFAPESRARLLIDSPSWPVMMMNGSLRTRASLEPRTRASRPKPSSFGMSKSQNTSTIEGSLWIASQPASPSAASITSNVSLRMRLNVVRTNFESSTRRTCFAGISAGQGSYSQAFCA